MVDIKRLFEKFNKIISNCHLSGDNCCGTCVSNDTQPIPSLGGGSGRGSLTRRPLLKAGFSLAEVLIAMLIMSIFYVATTRVMTTRQKPQVQENPHGYYECYVNGGLTEHRVDMGRTTIQPHGVASCVFNPPKGLPFFNVYIAIPGIGFYSSPEAQLNSNPDGVADNDASMVFSSPQGLVDLYRLTNPNIDQEMSDEERDIKYQQFRAYLANSHPGAEITQAWTENAVEPPYPVVLIVW